MIACPVKYKICLRQDTLWWRAHLRLHVGLTFYFQQEEQRSVNLIICMKNISRFLQKNTFEVYHSLDIYCCTFWLNLHFNNKLRGMTWKSKFQAEKDETVHLNDGSKICLWYMYICIRVCRCVTKSNVVHVVIPYSMTDGKTR